MFTVKYVFSYHGLIKFSFTLSFLHDGRFYWLCYIVLWFYIWNILSFSFQVFSLFFCDKTIRFTLQISTIVVQALSVSFSSYTAWTMIDTIEQDDTLQMFKKMKGTSAYFTHQSDIQQLLWFLLKFRINMVCLSTFAV